MSYQGLAQPAPAVGEAIAQPASESKSVTVEAAENVEELNIEAAPVVDEAIVGDFQKFAPKITSLKASALSVAELKKQGIDFESEAGVIKDGVKKDFLKKFLPLCFDERDFVSYGEVRRFLFIRGNCIFVYGEKSDPTPLYVIELQNFRSEIEDPAKPDKRSYTLSPQAGTNMSDSCFRTVLLKEKGRGKLFYQMTFDTRNDKSVIKRFLDVLKVNGDYYGGETISASAKKLESKSSSK